VSESTFQRLHAALAELIAHTPPGARLPSEPKLARELGVSRATLREAMRAFESQGLLRRKQGVGTFVVHPMPALESGLEVLESIETLAARRGMSVEMGELTMQQAPADPDVAAELEVEPGTTVLHVSRVIHVDRRPVAYLVDVLPLHVLTAADLEKPSFRGSVLDFLLRRGDPPLHTSYAEITAVAAPSHVAQALDIQRGDVMLQFTARLFASDGGVVAYSLSYFLPGVFRFHVVRRVGTAQED